ncbi:hypothetical protein BDV27DRAFT_35405 [Aspergillus caelatus]|uniref:Uncharacterized protein n=1 Tax=Aspergillus caelatus TaxID=61420 RepID=A0A5N7AMX1_9EURO|nr:uncharacterized protein BDV27DRAFT_35405 [Aspergillus caelatus]KAE8370596.1 hypothetical protein BDV27DRAFT_35405 [Aspergillus caelatus]
MPWQWPFQYKPPWSLAGSAYTIVALLPSSYIYMAPFLRLSVVLIYVLSRLLSFDKEVLLCQKAPYDV